MDKKSCTHVAPKKKWVWGKAKECGLEVSKAFRATLCEKEVEVSGKEQSWTKRFCPGKMGKRRREANRLGKQVLGNTWETWTISGLEDASAKARPANFQFLHSENMY